MPTTTAQFIQKVRIHSALPSDQGLTDAQILLTAEDILRGELGTFIAELGEGYYTRHALYAPNTTGLSRSGYYALPSDMGSTVDSLVWLDTNGDEHDIAVSSAEAEASESNDHDLVGEPQIWYITGGSFYVWPQPNTGALRLRYSSLPLSMGASSDLSGRYGEITSITRQSSTLIRIGFAASSMASTASEGYYLLSAAGPYAVMDHIAESDVDYWGTTYVDIEIADWHPCSSLFSTSDTLVQTSVGGYIIDDGAGCPYIQLPESAVPALVYGTVAQVMMLRGDGAAGGSYAQKYLSQMELVKRTCADRIKKQSTPWLNANSHFDAQASRRGWTGV